MNQRNMEKFLKALAKLSVEEFCGVAKMMNVELVEWIESDIDCADPKKEPILRNAEDIINEMYHKFQTYNRVRRRNLMSIIEAAGKKEK